MKNIAYSFAVPTLMFLAACAAGQSDGTEGGAGGTGVVSSTTTADVTGSGALNTSSSGGNTTTTTGSIMSGSTGTGGSEIPIVYAHSPDTLYKLDPDTKVATAVAAFSGIGSDEQVIDIALDKDSNFFATTQIQGTPNSTAAGLYKVDPDTAVCTLIAHGKYPNSLSFVPAGTVDPDKETLVGYVLSPDNRNQYVKINTSSGLINTIGAQWPANLDFVTSGDIVSVKDGPTYLTVKGGDQCGDYDCLVEVNPQTGSFVHNYGQITTSDGGYYGVFGLAFWAGSVFGFTSSGELFEVKVQGNALLTTALTAPSDVLKFWGPASTTSAPPVPQ